MATVESVRLRPVESGDLPQMFEWQLDPDSNQLAVTNPRTREAFDALWREALQNPRTAARAILADEVFAGFISCFQVDGHDHVGYWIDRNLWGKGIASRALSLLLQEVPQRPLTASAATSNKASLRILQKCGFVIRNVRVSPASERYPECEEAILVLESAGMSG